MAGKLSATGGKVEFIDPNVIMFSRANPRRLNEESPAFVEFVENVKASGVMIPVHLRKTDEGHMLLAGERRVRAAIAAGLMIVPTIIHENITDSEAFEITFAENYGREDLTALEEEKAVESLLEHHGGDVRAVAARLGWSEKQVRLRMKLTDLCDEWRKLADDPAKPVHAWSAAHLGVIARFPAETQKRILNTTCASRLEAREISVAKLEQLVEQFERLLRGAKWDLADVTINKSAGACVDCPKRSSCQPSLFDIAEDVGPGNRGIHPNDTCLDPSCWNRKHKTWLRREEEKQRQKHPDLVKISREWGRAPKGTISRYDFQKAKKSDKNAVPAFDTQSGQVEYIKLTQHAKEKMANDADESGMAPVPLKELRQRLQKKRNVAFCEQLIDALIASDKSVKGNASPIRITTPTGKTVLLFAALFGVNGSLGWKESAKKKFGDLRGLSEFALHELLWAQALELIGGGINHIDTAKAIAAELGINVEAEMNRIASEIPEPAEWATLKADGTPKVSAKPVESTTKESANPEKPKRKAAKKTAKKAPPPEDDAEPEDDDPEFAEDGEDDEDEE